LKGATVHESFKTTSLNNLYRCSV